MHSCILEGFCWCPHILLAGFGVPFLSHKTVGIVPQSLGTEFCTVPFISALPFTLDWLDSLLVSFFKKGS